MAASRPLTWLITGASSGLGAALAIEALKASHKVVGTTRNIESAAKSCPDFAANGGIWAQLDPAREDAFDEAGRLAREHDVDVLVNNAGYAFIAGVEDTDDDELHEQFEVNYFGPLRLVRACLPVMRAKKSGHIVLMSSGAGFQARPGRSPYAASKFAIEAAHESLSREVNTFNIRVLIVEPGSFRTPFISRVITPSRYLQQQDGDAAAKGFSAAYEGTMVEQIVGMSRRGVTMPEWVKGDPGKAARLILGAVEGGHEYLRLPLGPDCVKALEDKIADLKRDLEATRALAMSTNVDE